MRSLALLLLFISLHSFIDNASGQRNGTELVEPEKKFPSVIVPKIYHGNKAKKGEFPFMVLILVNGKKHCSGFLVDKRIIVTAAHCVRRYGMSYVSGEVDATNLDYVRDLPIKRCIKHHMFERRRHRGYDLAICEIDPITRSPNVDIVRFARKRFDFSSALAVGMGKPEAGLLKYANVSIVPCPNGRLMICTRYIDGHGRHIDSGSPLVIKEGGKWLVVGVLSSGTSEALKSTNYYVSIEGLTDWLVSNMNILIRQSVTRNV